PVRGEVALAYLHGMALVAVFRRNEPKRTVPLDWTTDRASELLAHEVGSRLSPVESGHCLQRLVPEIGETRAMVAVRARLGNDIDDAGAGSANFGGELIGRDLEFLHAVFGKVHQRAAHNL